MSGTLLHTCRPCPRPLPTEPGYIQEESLIGNYYNGTTTQRQWEKSRQIDEEEEDEEEEDWEWEEKEEEVSVGTKTKKDFDDLMSRTRREETEDVLGNFRAVDTWVTRELEMCWNNLSDSSFKLEIIKEEVMRIASTYGNSVWDDLLRTGSLLIVDLVSVRVGYQRAMEVLLEQTTVRLVFHRWYANMCIENPEVYPLRASDPQDHLHDSPCQDLGKRSRLDYEEEMEEKLAEFDAGIGLIWPCRHEKKSRWY